MSLERAGLELSWVCLLSSWYCSRQWALKTPSGWGQSRVWYCHNPQGTSLPESSRICACLSCPERRTLSFVSYLMLTLLVSFDVLRVTKSRGDIIIGFLRGFDQDENILKVTQKTVIWMLSLISLMCFPKYMSMLQVARLVLKMTLILRAQVLG